MYLLLVQWTQFKFSYISKTLTRDGLKVNFFPFFFLYINRFLTIECLLKKCVTEELPCDSFLRTIILNRGNLSKLSREKSFYFCVNELICVRFQKFSIRENVDQNFIFFTFACQCKLFELLSYGEYNHHFFYVICFLKTTHLSVHRLNSLIFFSCWINSTHIIFLLLKKYWSQQQSFKNTEKVYIYIKFSLRNPCCETDYERAQNWSFSSKILLGIISMKLFVLWQVLKPPLRKVIFKRILRRRFCSSISRNA